MPGETNASRGRRRRSRNRRTGLFAQVTSRHRRLLKWAALGLVALYLLIRLALFWLGTWGYADVGLENSRAEVLYSLGAPERAVGANGTPTDQDPSAQSGAGQWFYPTGAGGRIAIGYDAAGRVTSIGCGHDDLQPFSCPAMLGTDIGTEEGDLYRSFGSPSRERIVDGTKLAIYDDVGVTYRLKRFRVYQMELRADQGGFFGKFGRFIRSLVP